MLLRIAIFSPRIESVAGRQFRSVVAPIFSERPLLEFSSVVVCRALPNFRIVTLITARRDWMPMISLLLYMNYREAVEGLWRSVIKVRRGLQGGWAQPVQRFQPSPLPLDSWAYRAQ